MSRVDVTPEFVRAVVGELTPDEAQALAEWYAGLLRGLAAFPASELHAIEPPLRSTPGPA